MRWWRRREAAQAPEVPERGVPTRVEMARIQALMDFDRQIAEIDARRHKRERRMVGGTDL